MPSFRQPVMVYSLDYVTQTYSESEENDSEQEAVHGYKDVTDVTL